MGMLQRLTVRRRVQSKNTTYAAGDSGRAKEPASKAFRGSTVLARGPLLAMIAASLCMTGFSTAQSSNPRFPAGSPARRTTQTARVSHAQPNEPSISEPTRASQVETVESGDVNLRARQAILHSSAGGHPVGQIPEGFRRRRARLVADFQTAPMESASNSEGMPLSDNIMSSSEGLHGDTLQSQLGTRNWSEVDEWTEPGADGTGTYDVPGNALGEPYEVVDELHGGMHEGEMIPGGYYDDCDACDSCAPWSCGEYMTQGHFSVFGGVQGYKGGGNLGLDGSFGFNEGVNVGLPIPLFPGTGLGCQVGFRALQSNLSSSSFTFEQRNQTFFTTGIFRRVPYGLQGGIAFDLMKDEWYDDLNLGQIRGEIGWKLPCQHEWGYYFAAGDSGDDTASPLINGRIDRWTPVDFHSFYYRRRLSWCPGGTARFYTGFSSDQDGLVGAESYMPINRRWAVNTSFAYLIPDESSSDSGNANETWNLAIGLVWSWNGHCEYQYRPLFDVADNGSFFFRPEE
jgi:hypothetical protein